MNIVPGQKCTVTNWDSLVDDKDLISLFEETEKPIRATVVSVKSDGIIVTPELLREIYLEILLPVTDLDFSEQY